MAALRAYIWAMLSALLLVNAQPAGAKSLPLPACELELSTWNPKLGSTSLAGDWCIWWDRLVEDLKKPTTERAQIPGGWKLVEPPYANYATFGLALRGLPENIDSLGFQISSVDTAHRLWAVDSRGVRKEILSAGRVAKSEELALPAIVSSIGSFAGLQGPELFLYLEVSSFRTGSIGIWRSPKIGPYEDLRHARAKTLGLDFLLMGILLMAGITHGVFYALRRNDKSNLWFALLCFDLLIRHASVRRVIESFLGTEELWVFAFRYRVEWLTVFLGPVFFLKFVEVLFPSAFSPKTIRRFCIAFVALVFSLAAPTFYFSSFQTISHALSIGMVCLVLWVLSREAWQGNRRATQCLLAFAVLAAAGIHDIFNAQLVLGHPYLMSPGLVVFVILQSYFIARMFADSQQESSALAAKLKVELDMRISLEGTLHEVRQGLVQSREELLQAETHLLQADKMATLGQLIAGIGHELRNPLQAVDLGYRHMDVKLDEVQAILDPLFDTTSTQAVAVKKALDEHFQELRSTRRDGGICVAQMTAISNALHRGARLDPEAVPTDLGEVLEDSLLLVTGKLKVRTVTASIDGVIPVMGKPSHLRQVFTNLLANAADALDEKYGGSGGNLSMRSREALKKNEKGVEIIIEDDGAGVPENLRDKILEPFFTTKQSGVGTGIGLAVTSKIILQHGGFIHIGESETLGGAAFTVWLPAL